MFDEESEMLNFRLFLFIGVAFLFSAFWSFSELKYMIWSHDADAEIVAVRETFSIGRRGRRIPKLEVEFNYKDSEGQQTQAKQVLNTSWEPNEAGVQVRYFQGVEGSERIKGSTSSIPLYIFAACLIAMGYYLFKFYREANEPGYR